MVVMPLLVVLLLGGVELEEGRTPASFAALRRRRRLAVAGDGVDDVVGGQGREGLPSQKVAVGSFGFAGVEDDVDLVAGPRVGRDELEREEVVGFEGVVDERGRVIEVFDGATVDCDERRQVVAQSRKPDVRVRRQRGRPDDDLRVLELLEAENVGVQRLQPPGVLVVLVEFLE